MRPKRIVWAEIMVGLAFRRKGEIRRHYLKEEGDVWMGWRSGTKVRAGVFKRELLELEL